MVRIIFKVSQQPYISPWIGFEYQYCRDGDVEKMTNMKGQTRSSTKKLKKWVNSKDDQVIQWFKGYFITKVLSAPHTNALRCSQLSRAYDEGVVWAQGQVKAEVKQSL